MGPLLILFKSTRSTVKDNYKYETILGWAGKGLQNISPVFDANIDQINSETDEAGLIRLVKLSYMMEEQEKNLNNNSWNNLYAKIRPFNDDKMHARSIGPYSLILSNR